ncbi:unnamed protein product [Lepeophtheirus salmonis]|uniref:(salmon louse) hypothetical protein n=1 Tax=Lepeophtheirus salmonis TaxID=72036 RepID=A0A7R8CBX9_LEPSM|nr:unnamed protein product [Lepeophtheirus salmonis]CAF2765227.1 unnamed protein product [Lepeophtheirus salmonis]
MKNSRLWIYRITKLSSVPEGISNCKSLLVLNMSHNQLETIPSSVLMSLTDLLYFDVSHNDLDTLPPQLRRLANLQTLDLNPDEDQAKVLKGMKDIAKANKSGDKDQIEENESIKAKRWDEALEKTSFGLFRIL